MEPIKISLSMPAELFDAFNPKHNYECITPEDIATMDPVAMLEFMKEIGDMKKESKVITMRKDTHDRFKMSFSDLMLKYVLCYIRYEKEGIADGAE